MTPLHDIAIDQRTAPEQIARGLRGMILSGELPPGRPLRESVLAGELGVARNTIREAVRILERSGLVRYRRNHGAVVREPSQAELADLYQARLAMELGAAWTGERGPEPEAAMMAALDAIAEVLRSGEPEAAIDADLGFHETLVASAGSDRLTAAYAPLVNELRLYLNILSTRNEYEDAERIIAEHRVIAEAFVSGDRARLAVEIELHIRTNAERVSQILAE